MQARQLPLGVQLRDDARFDDFLVGENAELVMRLKGMASGESGQLLVHGGTGKTHLLQAACKQAMEAGWSTAYLPLSELKNLGAGVLEGLPGKAFLCLDDIHEVVADREWALALMRRCDVARTEGGSLVFAANHAAGEMDVAMPDLVTRLAWGGQYALKPLTDHEKLAALQLRARTRGLELPAEVGKYLISRSQRDLSVLMEALSRLDVASLAAQRRLTIPFVKAVMEL